jgi:hypothetical protein
MHDSAVPPATDACRDAETLAAWVDGGLPAGEAAAVEAHASVCGRCQAMIATLIRTLPPAPPREPWWRRRWFVAGLVPLTAAVGAIAIWIATPREPMRVRPTAEQRGAMPPTVAQPQPAPPVSSAPSSPPEQPQSLRQSLPRVDRMAKGTAREERSRTPPPAAGREEAADARLRDQPAAARPAPPAAPPPPPAAGPAPQLNETMAGFRLKAAFAEIVSPDGSVRWRIGPAGMVQRSSDQGATWDLLSSGATEDLTAGAAPSPTVCWIVGRAGTVLRTTDGRAWERVAFPERADLVAIQAEDSAAATVTTADGLTFRTTDGGRTWIRS